MKDNDHQWLGVRGTPAPPTSPQAAIRISIGCWGGNEAGGFLGRRHGAREGGLMLIKQGFKLYIDGLTLQAEQARPATFGGLST